MDKVTECLDALIEEMRESRAYQNYLWMEEELEKDPDLKSRVDDYRIRNYRLQQSENVDLYDAVDSLERDSYALRKSEKANAYLEAELEVCKMVQKVQDRISEEIRIGVQVRSGMEAKELGELLKDNGLIDESLLVFEVQYRLSGYYGGIKDGSYVLNTAQTVDEMLEILAGVNTEGQPSAE